MIDTAKQHKRRDSSQYFCAKMGCGASSVGAVDHVAGNVEASRGQVTPSHKGRLHPNFSSTSSELAAQGIVTVARGCYQPIIHGGSS